MSAWVESNLALILFLPWVLILSVLFWWFPRQPRTWARRLFDFLTLSAAALAFAVAVHWAYAHADASYGRMWKQVFATSVGYGVYLAALLLAYLIRRAWFARMRVDGLL